MLHCGTAIKATRCVRSGSTLSWLDSFKVTQATHAKRSVSRCAFVKRSEACALCCVQSDIVASWLVPRASSAVFLDQQIMHDHSPADYEESLNRKLSNDGGILASIGGTCMISALVFGISNRSVMERANTPRGVPAVTITLKGKPEMKRRSP